MKASWKALLVVISLVPILIVTVIVLFLDTETAEDLLTTFKGLLDKLVTRV